MANATQTYGSAGTQLSAENKSFYDRVLLERLLPNLTFTKYGQKKSVPKREGAVANYRRFNSLSPITTALTEGATPTKQDLSMATVNATVSGYGGYVEISDQLDLMGIDPVLTETAQVLGEQAALSIDTIVRDIVAAGTNVIYSAGAARNAVTGNITAALLKQARRLLKTNNAKGVEGQYYIGIVHPYVSNDIMGLTEWVDASKYAGSTQLFDGELGRLYGIRFIESSNAPKWAAAGAAGVDVYGTIILGANAYGVVDVAGSSKPEMIVKGHGSSGTSDPLNQRATAGWKAYLTAARLNESAMVRIESSATA